MTVLLGGVMDIACQQSRFPICDNMVRQQTLDGQFHHRLRYNYRTFSCFCSLIFRLRFVVVNNVFEISYLAKSRHITQFKTRL